MKCTRDLASQVKKQKQGNFIVRKRQPRSLQGYMQLSQEYNDTKTWMNAIKPPFQRWKQCEATDPPG
jgi:hypothetical protein